MKTGFNYEAMDNGGKRETLRDFCGSFYYYDNKETGLLHLIPEATYQTVFNNKEYFDCKDEEECMALYREYLFDGINALMINPITRGVITKTLTEEYRPTIEEVRKILDIYYVYTVPTIIEQTAYDMLKKSVR